MEQKVQSVIIDDEANTRENIMILLNKFCPRVEILGQAGTIDEAEILLLETKPQLVFLDIQLGAETIFVLLKRLPVIDFEIIFITAYGGKYALKALEFMSVGYLLKPIDIPQLVEKVDLAISRIHKQTSKVSLEQMMMQVEDFNRSKHKIALSTARGYELVYINDIMYCEADGSYTHFHFREGPEMVVSKNLKYYENMMVDYGFIRSHNTVLVNLRYIKTIERSNGGGIIMEDGKTLAVSKTRRQELEQRIKEQRRLV